jgi:hypothetical protein
MQGRILGPVERFLSRDWIAGAILIIVGLFLLAGRFLPGLDRLIPLFVGLGLLGVFFVTRSPGALIPGGIVTGVGVGILVAIQGDPQFGGAGFLLSLGGGFLLVSFLGALYQIPESRYWPLIPGSILVAIGALIFAAQLGSQVLRVAADWWPIVLVIVGAYLLIAARLRQADEAGDETRPGRPVVRPARPSDGRESRDEETRLSAG